MDSFGASSSPTHAAAKPPWTLRLGQSCATDARDAVADFYEMVARPDMELVLFFCSAAYDLDVLAHEMNRRFTGVQVVGCTTAGEIGPEGCRDNSISGVSFAAGVVCAVTGYLPDLQNFEVMDADALALDMLQRLERRQPRADASNTFAFLLIDGLSVREESVTGALQHRLGERPLVGGSAGDGVRFGRTLVYADGAFRADSFVLVLISTSLPFRPFKLQHFVPTDERVVVTAADAERRIIHEIDGRPAAAAYAKLMGVAVERLDPTLFAAKPIVVLIDGTYYVRSIQSANPDGSLTLFSSIEEGLVLRAARGVDVVQNLEDGFAELRNVLGELQVVIGADCILRRLEYTQIGLLAGVDRVFRDNNVVGFNSYGEQFSGVHINQTMVGIAIGTCDDA